jgi:hypothetical protein
MLRGTIEVEVTDGTVRCFSLADLVFVADTTRAGHVTRAVGDRPFEALFDPTSNHRRDPSPAGALAAQFNDHLPPVQWPTGAEPDVQTS